MRKKINSNIIFFLGIISIDLMIKLVIEIFFSHTIDEFFDLGGRINFHPVKNTGGMGLLSNFNVKFTSWEGRGIMFALVVLLVLTYSATLFYLESNHLPNILVIPTIMINASAVIRLILSFIPGYTLDYISVNYLFICDLADIYLWVGCILVIPIYTYVTVLEEKKKKQMELTIKEYILYDIKSLFEACMYLFKFSRYKDIT